MITLEKGAKEVVLPAGVYVIGDPCYHVPDEQWDRVLGESDFFDGQCHATFETFDHRVGTVVAFSTAYGDGTYTDGQRREYGVDSGLIGIISLEDIDPEELDLNLAKVVNFTAPVVCYEDGGVITFGLVSIDTADEPADEPADELGENFDD